MVLRALHTPKFHPNLVRKDTLNSLSSTYLLGRSFSEI